MEVQEEIHRLEKLVSSESYLASGAQSRLSLALLYSHHDNPTPDYRRALEKIREYLLLNPEGGRTAQVLYLMALLEEIDNMTHLCAVLRQTLGDLSRENGTLRERNEQLRKKNGALVADNGELKEVIEGLKNLEIQLEQERKLNNPGAVGAFDLLHGRPESYCYPVDTSYNE
jgi:hypothetical protein